MAIPQLISHLSYFLLPGWAEPLFWATTRQLSVGERMYQSVMPGHTPPHSEFAEAEAYKEKSGPPDPKTGMASAKTARGVAEDLRCVGASQAVSVRQSTKRQSPSDSSGWDPLARGAREGMKRGGGAAEAKEKGAGDGGSETSRADRSLERRLGSFRKKRGICPTLRPALHGKWLRAPSGRMCVVF